MSDKSPVRLGGKSAEEAALELLEKIAAVEKREFYAHGKHPADRKYILDTYDECLTAAKGFRNTYGTTD